MASAWGDAWGEVWGDSWGQLSAATSSPAKGWNSYWKKGRKKSRYSSEHEDVVTPAAIVIAGTPIKIDELVNIAGDEHSEDDEILLLALTRIIH